MTDRLPPHDLEAERAVLGSVLTDQSAIAEVLDFLHPDDFYRPAHQVIFGAMVSLYEQGKAADVVTLAAELNSHLEDVGGSAYLASLSAPTSVHIEQYGQIVARKSALRRLIAAAGKIAAIGYEDGTNLTDHLERAEAEFRAVATIPSGKARVEKIGLGYRMDVAGYVFHATRITESRGEVWCHLTVDGLRSKLVRPVHVNLSTNAARKALATTLATRSRARTNWLELVEQFAGGIIEARQIGEPITRVGTLEEEAEPNWLIDHLIPSDVATCLYGPQGIRKSTLSQILAVGCESGVSTIPGWTFARCHVGALDWEADKAEWNRRIRAVAAGVRIEPPSIFYRACSRPLADQVEELAALRTTEDIGFWIVDSTGPAMRKSADGADPSGAVEELYNAIRAIGGTWLLIDHVSSENFQHNEGAIRKPIGSVLKLARARAAWELKAERDCPEGQAELLLRCEKLNAAAAPRPISLRIHYEPGVIRVSRGEIEAPDLVHTLPQQDQMARFLWGGPKTIHDIALELERSDNQIRTLVSRFPARFVRLDDLRIANRSDRDA
jgi:DnaB-like helicase N terminal domain/AAA domain